MSGDFMTTSEGSARFGSSAPEAAEISTTSATPRHPDKTPFRPRMIPSFAPPDGSHSQRVCTVIWNQKRP